MHRAWRRILRRYRGLFHSLVVAFALHVSGVGHVVADAIGCAEHDEPDCCEGDECPPGCPDCHCSHATTPVVIHAFGAAYEFATAIDFAPAVDGDAPPSFSCGIYRPPRA